MIKNLKTVYNFTKKYIWIITSCFAVSAFLIKEETRNFVWNNGITILLILQSIIIILLLIVIIIGKLKIPHNDVSVYNRLMNILNLHSTEYILRDMQNNLPIALADLRILNDFVFEIAHVNNRILNKKLNRLMMNFSNSLSQYLKRHASCTVPIRGNSTHVSFDPEFKQNNHELYESRVKELDDLASEAFRHLGILMNYAAKKNINRNQIST
ncbi:MAG: hypothetical protein HY959_08245 [Ignavibacteriae bacterium]|nr:hypothetical protein [Ignavibacteriota bacterium]